MKHQRAILEGGWPSLNVLSNCNFEYSEDPNPVMEIFRTHNSTISNHLPRANVVSGVWSLFPQLQWTSYSDVSSLSSWVLSAEKNSWSQTPRHNVWWTSKEGQHILRYLVHWIEKVVGASRTNEHFERFSCIEKWIYDCSAFSMHTALYFTTAVVSDMSFSPASAHHLKHYTLFSYWKPLRSLFFRYFFKSPRLIFLY